MGCCESRHDPSQFSGFNNRPHNFDPSASGASGALEAVSRAADAIKGASVRPPEPGSLRDMRLALLSLPREAADVPEVPEGEIQEVVQVLREEIGSSDVVLTGLVLMRYLAQRQENQKKMASACAVALVLKALSMHNTNPTLQGVACDTLGNLLQSEVNTTQFLQLKGVDSIFQVVDKNMAHTRVMEAACFLLGNVASTEEGLVHISRLQGGVVALKVLKSHDTDAELLRELLFLVSNMAQSGTLQEELLAAGAVEAIIHVMGQHSVSSEVQAMACSVLDNLSQGNKPQFNTSSEATIECILKSLRQHNSDGGLVRRAASALASIAQQSPPPRNLAAPAAGNAIAALVKAAKTSLSDTQAVVQVLRALEVLAGQRDVQNIMVDGGTVFELVSTVVNIKGAGSGGKNSLNKGSSGKSVCVARAVSLTAQLTENCGQEGYSAADANEVLPIIAAALGEFWSHPPVVIPSCTVLASLAKMKPNNTTSNAAHDPNNRVDGPLWHPCLEGLIKALRARPGDVTVAVSASVALAWICEKQATPAGSVVGDLMSAFVMIMRAHPRDGDVAEAGCFMFSTVAQRKDPQIQECVIKSGAPLLIVMVLRHFSQQQGEVEGVLRRGVEALRVVGLEEPSTAGAVKLAGAPAALQTIIERYPSTPLCVLATEALTIISNA